MHAADTVALVVLIWNRSNLFRGGLKPVHGLISVRLSDDAIKDQIVEDRLEKRLSHDPLTVGVWVDIVAVWVDPFDDGPCIGVPKIDRCDAHLDRRVADDGVPPFYIVALFIPFQMLDHDHPGLVVACHRDHLLEAVDAPLYLLRVLDR